MRLHISVPLFSTARCARLEAPTVCDHLSTEFWRFLEMRVELAA